MTTTTTKSPDTRSATLTRQALAVLAAVVIVAGCGDDTSSNGAASTDAPPAELDAVIAATSRFADVGEAIDAGYEAASPCVEEPDVGAMGVHYVNFALVGDPAVDPEQPEVLLYLPEGDELTLVGVEWMVVDDDGDTGTDDDRPTLFGRGFDGPMDGHGPEEPVHYDLHAWVFHDNPAGTFAPFNSSLACEG